MRLPWNDVRSYVGAPKKRDRRDLLLSSLEGDMPANAPYPGESLEEFIARTGGGVPAPMAGGDPRAAAMAKMFGNPATNPANTFNMGRTTENYLDPMMAQSGVGPGPYGMDQGQMAPDLLSQHSPMALPPPGTTPVEEMMTDRDRFAFGGDASMADAYGGPDPYTEGLPGATGPATPMQKRNRRIGLYPEGTTDDEFEQQEMLQDYENSPDSDDRPVSRDSGEKADDMSDELPNQEAESEQGMIQRQINKAGQGRSNKDVTGFEMTGDPDADADYIRGIIESGEDPDGAAMLEDMYREYYGYDLDGNDEDQSGNNR